LTLASSPAGLRAEHKLELNVTALAACVLVKFIGKLRLGLASDVTHTHTKARLSDVPR